MAEAAAVAANLGDDTFLMTDADDDDGPAAECLPSSADAPTEAVADVGLLRLTLALLPSTSLMRFRRPPASRICRGWDVRNKVEGDRGQHSSIVCSAPLKDRDKELFPRGIYLTDSVARLRAAAAGAALQPDALNVAKLRGERIRRKMKLARVCHGARYVDASLARRLSSI